ncbi:hypothetical protein M501DRAFT_1020451 [Patellaria atrata CBS 101060]|uniref:Uncharacterized protein n=1 Tax=Patellaria atrata CBS 101060 TaxID=1346257 RepID=A0A9P4S404_9PEZI|nr:hypothetical protein M501DRAFT_1020451 [Patellaria atrata CBS 101060]
MASHTSPNYKRMGFIGPAHSPPLEHIAPIGQGPSFNYTRPQETEKTETQSRPSTPSDYERLSLPEDSEDEKSSQELPASMYHSVQSRMADDADFTIEEITESDAENDSETEVVRPDQFEDARSENATKRDSGSHTGIVDSFQQLNCEADSESDEQTRRYRAKKKRWSAGVFKRSHSQSVGSDSDMEDVEALDAHDVGSSARRLRRRVRGPGDRSSLIFEDMPHPHIVEVSEPESGVDRGPPSLPSDIEDFTLDALPFWRVSDPMAIDLDSGSGEG